LYINHIDNIIANKDPVISTYIWSWLAHLIQRPAVKIKTALVVISDAGAGKNAAFDVIANKIIGRLYAEIIDDIAYLTGQFNETRMNKIFVVVDELPQRGTAACADKLKALITHETVKINRKGKTAITLDDYLNIVILSNNESPIVIDPSDRRYCIMRASGAMRGNADYFRALHDSINHPSFPLLLYNYLLSIDISNWNPRVIPITQHLVMAKISALPLSTRWLLSIGDVSAPIKELYVAYKRFCSDERSQPGSLQHFSTECRRYCKETRERIGNDWQPYILIVVATEVMNAVSLELGVPIERLIPVVSGGYG
jgi:putative DNA primase/helicase